MFFILLSLKVHMGHDGDKHIGMWYNLYQPSQLVSTAL